MISTSHSLLFIHAPRAAGTTIVEALDKYWDHRMKPGHQTLAEHHAMFPESKDYKSFLVVRNTYERLISLCFKKIGQWDETYFRAQVMGHEGDWRVIDDITDEVIHYDNLANEMCGLIRKWELADFALAYKRVFQVPTNKNRMPHEDWMSYYDDDLIALVRKHYEAELEIHGFKPNPVPEQVVLLPGWTR